MLTQGSSTAVLLGTLGADRGNVAGTYETSQMTEFQALAHWQYERSYWFHLFSCGAVLCAVLIYMLIDTTTKFSVGLFVMNMIYLSVGAGLIVLRIWSRRGGRPPSARLRIMFTYSVMVLIPTMSVLELFTLAFSDEDEERSFDLATWLSFILGHCVQYPFFGLAAASLTTNRWAYLAAALVQMSSVPHILMRAPPEESVEDRVAVQATAAAFLLLIWLLSGVYFLNTTAMSKEIFQSFKATQNLAEAKSRYIAAISHDFGAPIAVLTAFVDKLERRSEFMEGADTSELIGIRATIKLMAAIRHKAINLAKLEYGERLRPERVSFRVDQFVHDVSQVADHMPKVEGIQVTCNLGEGLREGTSVIADRAALLLILINFLSNAFKNTRGGVVAVALTIEQLDGGDPMLHMQVTDNGLGVPEAFLAHLFTPFAQSSKYRFGTGLGLYHVHELAVALGGEVGHRPNKPSGACFWVTVPFVPAEIHSAHNDAVRLEGPWEGQVAAATQAPTGSPPGSLGVASAGSAATDSSTHRPSFSVLVVDDDVFLRDFIQSLLLELPGVDNVQFASDGEQAISLITEGVQVFTHSIMDLQMPIMDGFESVRRLRAWEYHRQQQQPSSSPTARIHVVAASANSDDPGVHEECIAAGFDGVLAKPIQMKHLNNVFYGSQ